MTRAFSSEPLDREVIDDLVDLASRAPSAGKTQGWHLIVLEGADTARFWDITLPHERRAAFRWQRLLDAPVIALPFADPAAYVARYAEADKERSGLGTGTDAWAVPYWTVDASMAVMTLLLAAEDRRLGALFFGVFRGHEEVCAEFAVPGGLQLLGALALGHPYPHGGREEHAGRSASRPRRGADEIIHRSNW